MPTFTHFFKTVALLCLGIAPALAAASSMERSAGSAATGIPTTVVLTMTTPSTIYFGQEVDGAAKVTASDGSIPAGTISFYDGQFSICTIPVTQSETCPDSAGTGFAVGQHTLTAVYSGDATHSGSTSNPMTVTVLPAAKNQTAITLTSNANPTISGQSVTLTANVTAAGSSLVPTGAVTFLDGSSVLGTQALSGSGSASFSMTSLGIGSHSISASYGGDTNDAASVSAELMEAVNGPAMTQGSFSIAVTGSTTVGVGRMANLLVTVSPHGGFAQPVQLSCGDLPTEAACTFGTQTLPSGGGTTTLQLSTIAPHDCGSTTPYFESAGLPFAGTTAAFFFVLFLPIKKRRTIKGLLVALIAFGGLMTTAGCGTCTDLGTRPGGYAVRVVGTPAGATPAGAVTTKLQVNVTLQ
jgi:hypothetical protein